jgi:hypothetical protein
VAVVPGRVGTPETIVGTDLAALIARVKDPACVAVHMPIGLPQRLFHLFPWAHGHDR